MNEQLAAIRARRDAVTPGVWSASWAWGKSGEVYNAWAEAPFTSGTCLEDVAPQAEADATFIAAAPADIDALLAMVDALTGERDALAARLAAANRQIVANEARIAELTRLKDELAEDASLARQQAQAQLAAVPVSAIGYLMADIEPVDDGDTQRLHQSRVAVLEWLDAEQEAANAAAEMRAPTYNGGCW